MAKKKRSKKVVQKKKVSRFIYIGRDGGSKSTSFRGLLFDDGIAVEVLDPGLIKKLSDHPHFKAG